LRPEDVSARWLDGVGALHVPGYSLYNEPLGSAAMRAIEIGRARGALVSIDLSSRAPMLTFGRDRTRELIALARPDVLFANASEVAALYPRSRPSRLLELSELAVVKLGSAGARLIWSAGAEPQQIEVAASAIRATDTTGAGDAFAAGFLFSLLGASRTATAWSPQVLRRAALSGHRSAATLLRSAREEIGQ
jgi:sugar/nucleoside kinase (ribokinase family)